MSTVVRLCSFAVVVVVALALLVHDGPLGIAAGSVWSLVVVPGVALILTRRAGSTPRAAAAADGYWRTGNWQSGAR